VQASRLEQSYRDAITMLGAAGHYNDTDTGVHIWRMAAYARRLAEACGWQQDDCRILETAAPMHDTGKIGIPSDILRKPAKLDAEEWEVMKTHTRIGYDILCQGKGPVFSMAAEVALRHHEKWDGSGYPDGLSGEAIPESARIVALADVFDALTMKRPYKDPWPPQRAMETIRESSGSHFEPRLVRHFEAILPDILAIKIHWDQRGGNDEATAAAPGAPLCGTGCGARLPVLPRTFHPRDARAGTADGRHRWRAPSDHLMTIERDRNYSRAVFFIVLMSFSGLGAFVADKYADSVLREEALQLQVVERLTHFQESQTQLSRAFIATADPRYLNAYESAVDMRAGHGAIPLETDATHDMLHRILELPPEEQGMTGSYLAQLRRARLAGADRRELKAALGLFEQLTAMEVRAMERATGSQSGSVDGSEDSNLLYSQDYEAARSRFIKHVQRASNTIQARASDDEFLATAIRNGALSLSVLGCCLAVLFGYRLYRGITRTAEGLRAAREFSDRVLDTMGGCVVVLDRSGRIVRFNEAAQKLTGYRFEELQGRAVWDCLIPPEATPAVRPVFDQLVIDQVLGTYQNEWLTKDDGRRLLNWHNTVLHDARGEVSHVVAIGEDVTQQRRDEAELAGYRQDLERQVASRTRELQDAVDKVKHTLSAMDSAGIGVHWIGFDSGRVFYGNRHAAEMLGLGRDELNGRHVWEIDPGLSRQRYLELREDLRSQSITTFESRHLRVDGSLLPVEVTVSFQAGNGDQGPHFVCFAKDITARKRLETALEEKTRQLESILRNASIGIMMSKDRHFVWANPALLDIFGYGADELNGMDVRRLYASEDDYDAVGREVNELLREDQTLVRELNMRRKDGISIWVRASAKAVNPFADSLQLITVVEDITEHRMLETRNAQLATLVEEGRDFTGVTDLEGNILYLNAAAKRMVGLLDDDEVRRMHINDLVSEAHLTLPGGVIMPAVLKNDFWEGELTLSHRNGTEVPTRHKAILHRDWRRRPRFVSVLMQDVSAEKAVQQALTEAMQAAESANQAKSDFLANMSHEIRTPLNAVIGYLQLLSSSALAGKQRKYVDKAFSASNTLQNLLVDLLDFSRIEAGRLELNTQPFSLHALADSVATVLEKEAEAKGIQLRHRVEPECPDLLLGDAPRLSQVLLNLGSNAVKFTREGTVEIRISARPVNRADQVTLRFEVSDTGIGMSPELQEQMFQRFVQADSGSTRQQGGSGLGLAIANALVGLMGGEISVESVPGRGSRFWFQLTLMETALEPLSTDPAQWDGKCVVDAATAAALAGMHVLVAEDNPINQDVLLEMLEDLGVDADFVANGEEVLARVADARRPYDLVLMDVQMPVMDGIEAARELRTRHTPGDLPIVAVTANAQIEDKGACLAAGMNDFLPKPVGVTRLREVILRYVRSHGASGAQEGIVPDAVPGFDLTGAVERMDGQWSTYARLARRFLDGVEDTRRRLGALLSETTPTATREAVRLLHGLRGSAVTLGAEALAVELKQAEDELLGGEVQDCRLLEIGLGDALERAVSALEEIAAMSAPA
jgi:PAS domain S-box-containing protein